MRRVITSGTAPFLVAACCTLLGGLLLGGTAPAADLTWDPGGAGGGDGTWNTTDAAWNNGSTLQTWSNAAGDTAIFSGTAGTVTLGETITAGSITFNTAGYTINTGTFGMTATAIGGSGDFTKRGTGTLGLGGASSYSGAITIDGGRLQLNSGASLSSGTGITVNGGTPAATGSYPFNVTGLRNGLLVLRNSGAAPLGTQTVTLNNAGLMYFSPAGGSDTGTVPTVVAASGHNEFMAAPTGGTTGDTLAIANLTVANGTTAQFRSVFGTLGNAGDNGRITVANLNGSALANTNGILGGWASAISGTGTAGLAFAAKAASTNDIVAATPGRATNTSGATTTNQALASGTSTENWLVNGNATAANNTITTDVTINSLIEEQDVFINNGATLTLASGGLIFRNNAFWMQSSGSGFLTSGEANGRLYVTSDGGGGDQRIRVVIRDNTAPVSLIKSGIGRLQLTQTNTFTGGTIINQGTLALTGGGGSSGTIRGTATVNAGGTLELATGDATGFGTGDSRLSAINLVGGTLNVTSTSNQTLSNLVITMTGGSITGVADGNLDFFSGSTAVTTLASATPSTITGTQISPFRQGSTTFTVADGAAAIDLDISSVVKTSASGDSASAVLFKAGAGTMRLSAANTFARPTTIRAGTIIAANSSALGTSGTVTLNDSGTATSNTALVIDATAAPVTLDRPIVVAADGTGSVTLGSITSSGTNKATFAAAVTLGRNVTIDGGTAGGGLDITGGIAGAGDLTINGTAPVVFATAENTYAGSTSINGILQLGDGSATATSFLPDAQAVTIAGGGTLRLAKGTNSETIGPLNGSGTVSSQEAGVTSTLVVGGGNGSGAFSGVLEDSSGTLAFQKIGTGLQTLSGANTFTGGTTVTAGTLAVTGSLAAGSNVSVAAGGTLAGTGTAAGPVTVGSGGGLSPGTLNVGTLTLGSLTFGTTGGDTATVAIPVSAGGSLTSLLDVVGDITANGGANSVTFALGGNLALLDSGTYSLATYSGSQLPDLNAFTYSGTEGARQGVTLANGTGSIDLVVTNAFPIWVGDQGPGWSASDNWKLNTTDAPTSFISDDTVVFNDSAQTGSVDLTQDVAPATTTFSGNTLAYTLASTGGFAITSGSLVKNGAATVTINTANSFAGGTQITAGTLVLGADAALGSGAVSLEGGTLDLGGRSIVNAITLAGGSIIGSGTISGIVSEVGGARSLVVTSDLTLTGVNTFTGGTTISAGTLTVGGSGLLGGGSYPGGIVNNGRLAIATSADQTLSGGISGTGSLAKSGSGTLSLSGDLSYAGQTAIDAGTLSITTAANQSLAGAVTGSGTLLKAGPASLTLTAVSTFSGGLTISAGTLEIAAAGQLGNGSFGPITNNGRLTFSTSANQTITGAISGSGSLVKSGSGTLTMNATQTYSGATSISGGTLVVTTASTAGGSLSGTPVITVSDSGTLRIAAQDGLGFTAGRQALVINSGGTVTIDAGRRATIRNTITMTGGTLTGVGSGDANGNYSLLDVGMTATSDASGNPATISAERLALQNSGGTTTFNVSRGVATPASDLLVTGSITPMGVNTNGINKTGNGIMTLAGPANSYLGNTVVSAGTLAVTGTISATPVVSVVAATLDVRPGASITTGRFITTDNSGTPSSVVNQSGGTITVTGTNNTSTTSASVLLGHFSGTSVYNMSGGTLSAANAVISLGWDATSTNFNQSGGAVNVLGIDLANTRNNPAAYNLTGGTLTLGASGITANAAKSVNLGGGTVAASADWSSSQAMTLTDSVTGATFDTSAHAVSLSGALSGSGRLVMAGGTLTLSAANAFTGGTTVSGGTLRATDAAALGAGNVAVNAGGRLFVDAALDLGVGNSVSIASGGVLELADNASVPFAAGVNIAGFMIVPSASGNEGAVLAGTSRGGQAGAGWLARPIEPRFVSDILDISTGDGLGSVEPFVLSLTYDSGIAPTDEANAFLFWNSTPGGTATWVNAIDGNTGNNASLVQQGYLGSFADFQTTYGTTLTDYMGAYGRDAASDSVWAVVNHNSEFVVSVVPEPGSIAIMAGAAVAAALVTIRCRRRIA